MSGESSPLLGSCMPNGDANGEEKKGGNGNWSLESSETLLAFAQQNPEIYSAAHLLRDAVILSKSNSSFAHTDYLISSQSLPDNHGTVNNRLYRKILTNPLVKFFVKLSIFGLVTLSFIEPPIWCRSFNDGDTNPLNGCRNALNMKGTPAFYVDDTEDEVQDYYPTTGVTWLSVIQSLRFEWFFVTVLVFHTLVCFAKDGFSIERYLCINVNRMEVDDTTKKRMKTVAVYRYARIVALLLLIKGMITFSEENPHRPMSIMYRLILFISYSEGIQTELVMVFKMLPSLFGVFLVLTMVIAFYALIGIASFYNTKEGNDHFDNYIDGVWTLFTSMTSVIYPDVMMAGYNDNRFVALYFVSYMMLTFFFFQGVILGVIVDRYNSNRDVRVDDLEKAKAGYIEEAFNLLTRGGEVDKVNYKQLMAIFLILNDDFDEIPTIPQYEATLLFAILDTDGSEMLDEGEFANFGSAMLLEFISYDKYQPLIETYYPGVLDSSLYIKIRDMVTSSFFDYAVDIIVLLNALVVMVQMYPILAGETVVEDPSEKDGLINSPWEIVETVFTVLYVIEMALKVIVLGWNRYVLTIRNKFDGFITVLAVVATFYVYSPNSHNSSHLIRFIVMTRALRVFRLFMVVRPFGQMSKAFFSIIPAVGRVILFLFCIVYTFSWIGMLCFGGRITRDPNNAYSSALDGTDFAGSFYWANNFNDLLSGANVCWNLLVINNWNVFESGIDAVCDTKYYRFFFLFFYIFGVMIANNLVFAIIIEYFLEEVEKDEEDDEDALEGKANLVFDSHDMPTPKEFGRYVAVLKPEYHRTPLTKKTVLKQLFASRVNRE